MSASTQGSDDNDLNAIREQVRRHPARSRHVLDLPYRLASPAAQNPANRRIWRDARGNVVAYALAQTPMWTLDVLMVDCSPDAQRDLLAWGITRWRELAAAGEAPPVLFVDVLEGDVGQQALLVEHGFARHEWFQLHLSQPAAQQPSVAIPDGFAVRPLAGDAEVEAYVALHRSAFGSENMTVAWRRRTLAMPEYHSELDLVATAPVGQLVGFCIGWLGEVEGRLEGQIEPVGVHPDFQGCGLGRALLAEGLRRMHAAGARRLHIEVDGENAAARALYAAAGFRPAATILKYGLRV